MSEEYRDIISLHQGDIGHTKLQPMDIDTGNHPSIAQKPLHFTSKTYLMCLGSTRNVREGWNCFTKCLPLVESYLYCTEES